MTVFEAMITRGLASGQLVISTAGHDTGRVYLVIAVTDHFVSCIDGRFRPLDKPKRKRWRHVRPLGQIDPGWTDKLAALGDQGQKNALIRKLIIDHSGWTSKNPAES
ncbi:MAG: hypothetical protein EOM08_03235 [Clostridia bacterium]|nr:hypothetical protein [Clostridia bacterium]NCC75430.1 hypothetical protein [Clostridia bacterium]